MRALTNPLANDRVFRRRAARLVIQRQMLA
jgi:hypothetical protein